MVMVSFPDMSVPLGDGRNAFGWNSSLNSSPNRSGTVDIVYKCLDYAPGIGTYSSCSRLNKVWKGEHDNGLDKEGLSTMEKILHIARGLLGFVPVVGLVLLPVDLVSTVAVSALRSFTQPKGLMNEIGYCVVINIADQVDNARMLINRLRG